MSNLPAKIATAAIPKKTCAKAIRTCDQYDCSRAESLRLTLPSYVRGMFLSIAPFLPHFVRLRRISRRRQRGADLFLLDESNIKKKTNNHGQRESDNGPSIGIENIESFVHSELLRKYAITNENIARKILDVNMRSFLQPFSLEKLGTITTAPNQPAARLTNKSENTESQLGSKFCIRSLYQRIADLVNKAYFLLTGFREKSLLLRLIAPFLPALRRRLAPKGAGYKER